MEFRLKVNLDSQYFRRKLINPTPKYEIAIIISFYTYVNLFFSQNSEKLKEFVLDKYPDDRSFIKVD
jgi:hypothetical protein